MKYRRVVLPAVAAAAAVTLFSALSAQQPAAPSPNASVPSIRFESVPDVLKYSPDMNLGEVLGVAINSRGTLAVLNHPGSATAGPLYGNASTQIFEFDAGGQFVRAVGKGVYGLGYGHGLRYDQYDNLWIVDKGTHAVTRFNPAGYVGVKSWASRGREPGQFNTPHNIAIDRQNNVYVADRSNNRIQVFDRDGGYLGVILLNAPYDKARHPVLGNLPARQPDETAAWTLCITPGAGTQYLYATDTEPGRLYKLTLDGKIVGMLGESGHDLGQFNWAHGLACPAENTIYVADMNNWRVQKLILHP